MPQVWQMGGFDAPGVDTTRTRNKLRRFKLEQGQAEQKRQNQLREAFGDMARKGRDNALAAGGGPTREAAAQSPDPAMARIASADPSSYLAIQDLNQRRQKQAQDMLAAQSEAEREQTKREAAVLAEIGQSIQRSDNPAEAYERAKQFLPRFGVDVSDMPRQWGPRAQEELEIAQSVAAATGDYARPERERFTVNEGGQEVTYVGDQGDPSTWQRVADAPRFKPDQPSARDDKVQMLVDAGVPLNTAKGIVGGRYATSRDPVTGAAQILDKSTGKPVDATQEEAEAAEQVSQQTTLWEMAGDDVTGFMPALQETAQGITGQMGVDVASDELLENRQTFRSAKNELIRSLSINPKFPVKEIERINREVNIEPGAFTDERTLRARMKSVDRYLRNRLENERQAAENDELPAKTREAAAQAAKDIQNFLEIMGVPEDGGEETSELPQGVPEGSSRIGQTQQGLPVYETPDGRRLVVE